MVSIHRIASAVAASSVCPLPDCDELCSEKAVHSHTRLLFLDVTFLCQRRPRTVDDDISFYP